MYRISGHCKASIVIIFTTLKQQMWTHEGIKAIGLFLNAIDALSKNVAGQIVLPLIDYFQCGLNGGIYLLIH